MQSTTAQHPPQDWDDACAAVSRAYFPHVLTPLRRGSRADGLTVDNVDFGPLRIAEIGWGADVSVSSEHPGAYAVNIPVGGLLESRNPAASVVSTPGLATVNPPDTPTVITRWTSSCSIVGVKIDRDYLHREIARLLRRPDVRLPAQFQVREAAGADWLRMVRAAYHEAGCGGALWRNPVVAEQLSGMLTSALVLAAVPDLDARPVRPRIVTRVTDAVHADPARAWTPADLAEIAGVSIRRLQEGFREYVGMTPREFVADVRLERVRAELLNPRELTGVTDIALKWGFTHTGRFAAAYRRKYGEPPSATLRG
ncbi:AraC family transcriptional regulator [Nocardia farcinica]|uniref:Transcriptional regulator EutR n=2 Tax=Nocardia farcinica TaxID=37329 RepID=A0A0H5PM56_NOCFR|nr:MULTISPECIES: AraC family transcriptional regulator [Nocardia]AXK88245.1 AraC family transcriptional regulator [Nocardia farcinica]MBA4854713.1 AraC family transcriptional regulator [Nocardia farcinica]MBC9815124.1 AraC family transcriptional regulator [Nocardia farcinica]MBF6071692.1 AraC family transcriptional regulator [Nocardia farcinica]MBF6141371.1 AraC family transcriptional regulator [Nocardia farcinica]